MATANRIKFWRAQRGWTMQQLADASGTTRAQIDKLERGARRLTVDWMVRLAKPLGCDPRSLMAPGDAPAPTAQTGMLMPLCRIGAAGKLQPAARIARPSLLDHAPDAYAILATNKAIAPLLQPEQIALLAPGEKPRAGRAVLVADRQGRHGFYIFIKAAGSKYHLRRLAPRPEDVVLAQSAVAAIHPVVGIIEAALVRRSRK